MFKTVLIEDDPLSREALQDTLADFFSEFEVVATYATVKEATQNIPHLEVDLLLLDMKLSDGQGFDVLKNLEAIDFEVIITTMHDSFMLEAIQHSALDYLLKPITRADLEPALNRFKEKVQKIRQLKDDNKPKSINRLVVPHQNGLTLLSMEEIIRLESDGAYTKIFVTDGAQHLVSKNLGYYEGQLAPNNFLRVHNKHLISLDHVKNYLKGEGGTLIMSDGSQVQVSRRKKEEFLGKLGI
jgi:two-component system LytT family response regulator